MKTVLIADDEERIRKLVSDFLKKSGFKIIEAKDGEEAFGLFVQNKDLVNLIILDIMMPELNGWEVCKKVREISSIPVIMLSARSEEFDELTSYECGADDYVTKPFSPLVLTKKVEALLRRVGVTIPNPDETEFCGLVFNNKGHEVKLCNEEIELTLKEYNILKVFIEFPGRVFSREQLLDIIWGYDFSGDYRTVDSHVARLRTKLGDWANKHIKTVYGIGYKLEVNS